MGTLNVSLPDDLIAFVKDKATGRGFGSQSAVVADALRRVRAAEEKRATVLGLLRVGEADVDAGRTKPLTEELLRDIAERARARAAARRRPS